MRNGLAQPRDRYVDAGWDDFDPSALPEPGSAKKLPGTDDRRNYKASRGGGFGTLLRFLVFTGVLAGLVLGGLWIYARPAVQHAIADWAAENPTALQLPFVADIVRGELGASLTEPVDPADFREVVFVIAYGSTPAQIGEQLAQDGLITDGRAFVFEAIVRNETEYFISGRHVLTRAMTVDQIIDVLVKPAVAPPKVHIVFREGLRLEQIVAKLEYLEQNPTDPGSPLSMNIDEYYRLVSNPPASLLASYPWLKLPVGASLEGFLFPATYDVDPNITPLALVQAQLNAFENSAPPELFKLAPDKLYEAVQIASLVEPEVKVASDRPLVAGVYTNWLDPKRWPTALMNSDPTVSYAVDSVWLRAHPIAEWPTYSFFNPVDGSTPYSQLTFPAGIAEYNTYHHGGLPPTPICSPGAASIAAAIQPDTKDGYFYFLSKNDGSGQLVFAHNQAEQNANLKKYG